VKITTYAIWGSINDFIDGKAADCEVSYDYQGSMGGLDRWAQGAEKSAVGQDKMVAQQAGSQATADESQLTPFASQEMHAEHSLDPYQINQMLTAAGAGTGAAEGAIEGAAGRESALTRNASGFAKDLDLAARNRMKTGAGISEGIAAEDIAGAQKLRQEGAGLMTDLFKTDTGKQLEAMSQESKDIQGEVEAGKSGWLQNMNATLEAIGKVGSAAFPKGFQS